MKIPDFITKTFLDGDKPSFGRQAALPFFFAALCMGIADGVHSLMTGKSALDAVMTLAGIGVSVYTGSKALSIPTAKAQILADSTPAESESKAG